MNKNNGLQLNIEHIACYISLLIATIPVVDYYCNWYITVIPVIIIGIRLFKNNITVRETLKYILLVCIIVLLQFWVVYRENSFLNRTVNGFIAWLPGIIAIYANYFCDKTFLKNYLQTGAVFLAVTCITTIRGLSVYPQASRELASGTALYDTEIYTKQNIGGFEFIYALVVFIPICLWLIRNTTKILKIINIVILILTYLCIYASQYTTALILSIVILLVIFLFQQKYVMGIVLSAVMIMFIISGNSLSSVLSDFFKSLSDIIEFDYVSDRLLQISRVLAGKSAETETSAERINLYKTCWRSFTENPIFGKNLLTYNSDNISGHSFILDIMSGSGLLGLATVIFALRTAVFNTVLKGSSFINKYVLIELIAFLLISILNPSNFMVILITVFMFGTCIQRIEEIV